MLTFENIPQIKDYMFNLQVDGFGKFWQIHFPELSFLNLFNDDPVGLDGNGGLALFDLHGTVVLTTTLLLLPLAYLTLTLPSNIKTRLRIIPNVKIIDPSCWSKYFRFGMENHKCLEAIGKFRPNSF